jgi:hypothetical protein
MFLSEFLTIICVFLRRIQIQQRINNMFSIRTGGEVLLDVVMNRWVP